MTDLHKKRLLLICLFIIGLTGAVSLMLYALKQNMNVFLTPSQLAEQTLPKDYAIRLGGMVKPHSVKRDASGLGVTFTVTDFKGDISVHYQGVLPDLFQEGKGVIAEGHLSTSREFTATRVLAKHDENYMPREVYDAIRKNNAPAAMKGYTS